MARATYIHHVAWGIACVILLGVVIGLLAYAQTLGRANEDLKRQLRASAMTSSTCQVHGTWKADTTKRLSLQTGEATRDYLVHTPEDFVDGKYYPLLMAYPGKGATAIDAEVALGLDDLPAIVVYPFPSLGKDGFYAWQGAPYSSGSDDIEFTSAVMDKVNADLCIDKTKTYAVGYSNGGGFTALLSCKLSERFAAFAVIAGAMYYPDGACKPRSPSSLMTIHGDIDPVVPYEGSAIRKLPAVEAWANMRANIYDCKRPQTSRTESYAITTEWNRCDDGVVIKNIRLIGGGHTWGQVPNDEIWKFLSRFSK